MQPVFGQRPRQLASQENSRQRAYLPLPPGRSVPFILARYTAGSHRLICPWSRRAHGFLTPEQVDQLAAVQALLAKVRRPWPELAWVDEHGIHAITEVPGATWLARRAFDGDVRPIAAEMAAVEAS